MAFADLRNYDKTNVISERGKKPYLNENFFKEYAWDPYWEKSFTQKDGKIGEGMSDLALNSIIKGFLERGELKLGKDAVFYMPPIPEN